MKPATARLLKFLCGFAVGLVFTAVAIALLASSSSIVTSQIKKRVTIEEGHATYEQLESPTIPIYKDFYFFNLTNAEEFAATGGGVMPILEELGPYSFSEYRTKTFTNESDDTSQIGYTQRKIFLFNSTTSDPDVAETDIICTINIPLVAAIDVAKNDSMLSNILRQIIDQFEVEIYICQNATDLAWNYTDNLVQVLHQLGQYPYPYVNIQVNDSIADRELSIIHTGVGDISKIGQFFQWNGMSELDIWYDDEANSINGTEGLFFKPQLKKGENLTAFIDDIQRSVDIVYQETVSLLDLTAYRYGIDNQTFKSAFTEPKNARWGSWCPDGLFYLGPTQPLEIPVFGSKPHFLDGDPLLLDSVMGLDPIRSKHDTIVDVEPTTGANLNFKRKLQINVQVNRTETEYFNETSGIVGYNESDVLYFPVLYIDERAEADEDFKAYLEDKGLAAIGHFKTAVIAVSIVLLILGLVALGLGILVALLHFRGNKDATKTPLLTSGEKR